MVEMEEERLRMREHVMNEVCFKTLRLYVISMDYLSLAINLIRKWKINIKNSYLIEFCIFDPEYPVDSLSINKIIL